MKTVLPFIIGLIFGTILFQSCIKPICNADANGDMRQILRDVGRMATAQEKIAEACRCRP